MRYLTSFLLAVCLIARLSAQIPNTLLHSIPAPPVGGLVLAGMGTSVAVGGGYTIVGVPGDGTLAQAAGVVKVFDSSSGILQWVITNPSPVSQDGFGSSLALSGTRLVVGVPYDDEGASNAGSVYVFDLSAADPRVPVAYYSNPSPAADDLFGSAVGISGSRVVVGAYQDDTGAANAGNAYVYDLTNSTSGFPVFTLNNPSPTLTDQYGKAVAIEGARVAVGAWFDDAGGLNAGTVYLFDLAGNTPEVPGTVINNPSPTTGGGFGLVLALSDSRLVVGNQSNHSGASASGTVYVYEFTAGLLGAPLVLNNPTPTSSENFGNSVAISGTWLVIGAYAARHLDVGVTTGSVYVYDLAGSTPGVAWAELPNPTPDAGDDFGWAVAVSGAQVVVGARSDDVNATNGGSAFAFDLSSPTPTLPGPALNHPSPSAGDLFGSSMAISGNWLAVGAYATGGGRVYVYDLSSGPPVAPLHTLTDPFPVSGDQFGFALALEGQQLVVGVPEDDYGALSSGSVFVYDLAGATPSTPLLHLSNPTPANSDRFGSVVATSGQWVVAGVYADDTGAAEAGSAYVYDMLSATPLTPILTLNNPTPEVNENFGWAVAVSGNNVLVGAPFDTSGTMGRVYGYSLLSVTPAEPVITLSNPASSMIYFGAAVAMSGTRVVIGGHRDDVGATDAGSVFVYDLASVSPTVPSLTLNNPAPAATDYFGISVDISGMRVVVGARQDDAGAVNSGSVYVYDLAVNTPALPIITFSNPSPNTGDQFGWAVAIDGTAVAAGAPLDDSVMYDKGYAYIFGPHPLDQDSDGLRDAWELTYWPTTTGHGPLDDEDQDGIVNLLELAFNLNPTLANGAALPPAVNEGDYLTLTITKQPGVTYEVQSAGTLLPALPDSFSPASTTLLIDNATTLKVRDTVLMSTPGGRFMRAAVTASP